MSSGLRGFLYFAIFIAFVAVFCVVLPFVVMPNSGVGMALPVILLPGEPIVKAWPSPDFELTNTLIGALVTDLIIILVLVFLYIGGGVKKVPGRLQAFLELLTEFMYNTAKSVAGSRAAKVFPLVMTIFFFILIANLVKLVPGSESVGALHCAYEGFSGYPIDLEAATDDEGHVGGVVSLMVSSPLDPGMPGTKASFCACELEHFGHIPAAYEAECAEYGYVNHHEDEAGDHAEESAAADVDEESGQAAEASAGEGQEAEAAAGAEGEGDEGEALAEGEVDSNLFTVAPFVRGVATDLNFTIGLAIVAVIMIQVFGTREQGLAYYRKFLDFPGLGEVGKNPLNIIFFGVGLLEIISEVAKIISFAFRLFGSIFAGSVLMFVVNFLVALFLPIAVYGLEIFIGAIQAFVFAMLTLVFSAQAMEGHHGDDEHH